MNPISNPVGKKFICTPDSGRDGTYKGHEGHIFVCSRLFETHSGGIYGICNCGKPWSNEDNELQMFWYEIQPAESKLDRLKKLIKETVV